MSIYISGIDMPTHGSITITIRADGFVQQQKEKPDYEPPNIGKAIPVGPHGRLIDSQRIREAIIQKWMTKADDSHMYKRGMEDTYEVIRNAPTVIPASEQG